MQISAEDRERLAKGKFAEWFNELFDSRIEEAVKKHVGPTPRGEQRQQASQGQQGQGEQQEQPSPRRRSLLETCLSDTFGF
jgi:hypothetical protein